MQVGCRFASPEGKLPRPRQTAPPKWQPIRRKCLSLRAVSVLASGVRPVANAENDAGWMQFGRRSVRVEAKCDLTESRARPAGNQRESASNRLELTTDHTKTGRLPSPDHHRGRDIVNTPVRMCATSCTSCT